MARSQNDDKVSRPKWTQTMYSKNCRMRMPDKVSDALGALLDARLWFNDVPVRVPFAVDNKSLYFNPAGWKQCVDRFGFKKGMLIQFQTAPRRGPEDFEMTIKTREEVRRSKIPTIGQAFFVRMTKSYVYRTNATVTIPAEFGWWQYWGGVKTNRVNLQFKQCRHQHVVSVHCYEKGNSTKITRGWNHVVKCCGIKKDDIVIFKLHSVKPICFKVHVGSSS